MVKYYTMSQPLARASRNPDSLASRNTKIVKYSGTENLEGFC